MKKNTLILMFVLSVVLVNAQTPSIVYVAGDGSGDFNCDGISDQIEINQALDFVADNAEYTTVYLKGANTFWIDEPIYISANTILEGDSSAVIKLIDNAAWNTRFKPLIAQKGHALRIGLEDTSITTGNITIRGFEIDGNRQNQTEPSGNSYYNMICLQNCYNIIINEMYMHDNLADILNTGFDKYGFNINLKFYNNRVHASGHDGIYVCNSENIEIHDNNFTNNRTDAHIRLQYCNHFKIYNNIAGNYPGNRNSGGIGVDIQVKPSTPLDDAEIYNNFLYGQGAFNNIWLWQTHEGGDLNTHKDVYIHHNIIVGSQGAGIGIYGFNNTLIENNIIENNGDGDNRSILTPVKWAKQSGITFYEGAEKNTVKGFKTIVRNNIIGNNAAYGIENMKPQIHTFVLENNCIYNNINGNYNNASSNTDIYVNPDYAFNSPVIFEGRTDYIYNIMYPKWREAEETHNYLGYLGANEAILGFHLKSQYGRWNGSTWVIDDVTSFCVNSGNPLSDFLNEPPANGGRVNIGAFGNTIYASKSDKIPDVHNFIAYPNPTNGIISISEEFLGNEFYIFSSTGSIVMQGTLQTNKIDLSALSTGIYLIKIKDYNSVSWRTCKIVKYK